MHIGDHACQGSTVSRINVLDQRSQHIYISGINGGCTCMSEITVAVHICRGSTVVLYICKRLNVAAHVYQGSTVTTHACCVSMVTAHVCWD